VRARTCRWLWSETPSDQRRPEGVEVLYSPVYLGHGPAFVPSLYLLIQEHDSGTGRPARVLCALRARLGMAMTRTDSTFMLR